MTTVITLTPNEAANEVQPQTAARGPHIFIAGFTCVYLTPSTREAERAAALVEPAHIRIFQATGLEDAKACLKLSESRVLLTDATFRGGNWADALEMALGLRTPTALVVAARLADERLWLDVLQHGAYDLVHKPFQEDELRRVLQNAHSSATRGAAVHVTA